MAPSETSLLSSKTGKDQHSNYPFVNEILVITITKISTWVAFAISNVQMKHPNWNLEFECIVNELISGVAWDESCTIWLEWRPKQNHT